jgi:bifunctional non-homologous end joining protein LigD
MKVLRKSPFKSPKTRLRIHRPARALMPATIAPMLATLAPTLPANPANYAFEYKWDGVRALLRWDGKDLSVASRNLLDITPRYPEIHPITDVFGSRDVILDGEVIALDDAERPSFSRLQQRMHVRDDAAVRRLMRTVPVFYVVFDVLWLDGRPLLDAPWLERRDRLEELDLTGPAWLRSPAHLGEGADLLAAARAMKLEGIVAKHVGSPYRPGVRSPEWVKIKIVSEQEYVVGGWVPEAGNRTNRIGSLLLGYYDAQGRLRFAGGVGTGFDDEDHRTLSGLMRRLGVPTSPFADPVPKRGALYVKPETVVQIEYRRKGPEGILQQAAFKGIRDDKHAREVTDTP